MLRYDIKTIAQYFWLLILLPGLMAGCRSEGKHSTIEKEKKAIEKVINSSIGWARNKDLHLLHSIIANDADYLEVQPGEKVVKGYDDFRKAEEFWLNPAFKAIRYEIDDLKITLSESGTVAWWFGMLDDINQWKGEPANWINTRWTGVMEKRNGKWVIVQQHFSFASN